MNETELLQIKTEGHLQDTLAGARGKRELRRNKAQSRCPTFLSSYIYSVPHLQKPSVLLSREQSFCKGKDA